jgi:hypothetical protein
MAHCLLRITPQIMDLTDVARSALIPFCPGLDMCNVMPLTLWNNGSDLVLAMGKPWPDLFQSGDSRIQYLVMLFSSRFFVLDGLSNCSAIVNWVLAIPSLLGITTEAIVSGYLC